MLTQNMLCTKAVKGRLWKLNLQLLTSAYKYVSITANCLAISKSLSQFVRSNFSYYKEYFGYSELVKNVPGYKLFIPGEMVANN